MVRYSVPVLSAMLQQVVDSMGTEGSMMHRFFYRNFSISSFREPVWLLLGSFALGSLLGCLSFSGVSAAEAEWLCRGVLEDTPGVFSQIACGLLPLCLAGGLCLLFPRRPVWPAPVIFSGFLLSFSVCIFAGGCAGAGWLLAILLLLGRCASLPLLFWFLLRRAELGNARLARDFLMACGASAAVNLVCIWLLSSALADLSLFI